MTALDIHTRANQIAKVCERFGLTPDTISAGTHSPPTIIVKPRVFVNELADVPCLMGLVDGAVVREAKVDSVRICAVSL